MKPSLRAADTSGFGLAASKALGSLAGVWAALASSGCVSPPAAMEDYLRRTEKQRNEYVQAVSDAGANTTAGSFAGTYFEMCLSPLVAGDVARTLRFKATVDFKATSEGNGPLTLKLHALAEGAEDISAPVGPEFGSTPATVVGGKFDYLFGDSPDLPASANPISRVDWGIIALRLKGTFTDVPKAFCANLTGNSRPSNLSAEGTVCLFKRVESPTEKVTILAASDFTCPQ